MYFCLARSDIIMKTVILDFDGTIADTRECITETVSRTLDELGHPRVAATAITALIGLPLSETFIRLTGMNDATFIAKATDTYRRLFGGVSRQAVTLFPHVRETLRELHAGGLTLAIASSRDKRSLISLSETLGIASYIDMISGESDVVNKKPAPDMAVRILRLTGSDAADSMVVGDTWFDIDMGRGAGCVTCGVTYGNHTEEQLRSHGADFIISDFAELPAVIDGLNVAAALSTDNIR